MGRHFRRSRQLAPAAVPALLSILTMVGALSQALTGDYLTALMLMIGGTGAVAFSLSNLREIDRLHDKLMELRLRRLEEDLRTPSVTDSRSAGPHVRIVAGPAADTDPERIAQAINFDRRRMGGLR